MIRLDQTRKEILRIVLSPLVSTPKWKFENRVNRMMFRKLHPRLFKEKLSPSYRLKPTTLNLCHIFCNLNILLYCFKFKYFVQLLVILYIFCNLNILVQFNLLIIYIFVLISNIYFNNKIK